MSSSPYPCTEHRQRITVLVPSTLHDRQYLIRVPITYPHHASQTARRQSARRGGSTSRRSGRPRCRSCACCAAKADRAAR
eukprot:2486620-Pleurochrysis_carterae.AAC.1